MHCGGDLDVKAVMGDAIAVAGGIRDCRFLDR